MTTRNRTRARSLAPLAIAGALAACTAPDPGAPVTPTSSSSVVSSTSSPSTTSTPATSSPTTTVSETPEQRAEQSALTVLALYFSDTVRCLRQPSSARPDCFDASTIATERIERRNSLAIAQAQQSRAIGAIEVVSARVTAVELQKDVTRTPPVVPVVSLEVCTDVSKLNIVDRNGKSIVPSDRKPRVLRNISVVNYEYPAPDAWRVGYVAPSGGKTC